MISSLQTSTPAIPTRRLTFRDFGQAVLVVCLSVILIDLGMRVAGCLFESSFYTEDSERGYAFRPRAEGWFLDGRTYVRINSRGYHDREHSLLKPRGVFRIAVVGSSYIAGMGVVRTFPSFLESALNAYPPRKCRFEALDFGVEAYSAMQSYITLRKDVWTYQPDLILFALTSLDPLEDYRASAVNERFKRRPYYQVDGGGNIVPDAETSALPALDPAQIRAEDRENDLMNRSELALGFHAAIAKIDRAVKGKGGWGPGLEADAPLQEPKRILEVLFSNLKHDAQAHGAEIWIVTIGEPEQDNPDPKVRANFQASVASSDRPFFSDVREETMARAAGLPAIRLSPGLATYAEQHRKYLHGFITSPGFGHWNELGHRVVGETVANELERSSPALREHL